MQVIDRYPLEEATHRCGYALPPTLPFFAMPDGVCKILQFRRAPPHIVGNLLRQLSHVLLIKYAPLLQNETPPNEQAR